jgi:hypothetical protein
MSGCAVPASEIYVQDASPSHHAQVCGPLGGDSVQELLQIWETARSIGPKLHLLHLRAAGPVSTNGRQAIQILRAAGLSPLWPDQDGRFEHTKPFLAALQALFAGNLRYL